MSSNSARSSLGTEAIVSEAGERRLSGVVARYFASVWRSLRRFGVPESAADDAAQHVFLTFARRLDAIPEASERAFLASAAVRIAANVRRQHERARETPLDQVEPELAADATPEHLLEQKRRRAALDAALAALPFDQRTVFVLFELEGFTLPEIARSLDVPLGTATSRLRRARARFEAWVSAHDAQGDES